MIIFSTVGAPIILAVVISTASILSSLRDSIADLRIQIVQTKVEMINLKTLQEYQLRSFDDRLSAQRRRMDTQDSRIERLEKPLFDRRITP